jgi:hypothetical protein
VRDDGCGAPLVDDGAVDGRVGHQLPDTQHACVAAPTVLKIWTSRRSNSWVLSGFQVATMPVPICGYVMDTVG